MQTSDGNLEPFCRRYVYEFEVNSYKNLKLDFHYRKDSHHKKYNTGGMQLKVWGTTPHKLTPVHWLSYVLVSSRCKNFFRGFIFSQMCVSISLTNLAKNLLIKRMEEKDFRKEQNSYTKYHQTSHHWCKSLTGNVNECVIISFLSYFGWCEWRAVAHSLLSLLIPLVWLIMLICYLQMPIVVNLHSN